MGLTLTSFLTYIRRYPLAPEILSKHDEIEVHNSGVYSCLFDYISLTRSRQELLESYILDFTSLTANIEYARNQIENAEDLVRYPLWSP